LDQPEALTTKLLRSIALLMFS